MEKPEIISLSEMQIHELRQTLLLNSSISEEHRHLLVGILDNHIWLQFQLLESKMSIHRLRKLFGISTEKSERYPKNSTNNNTPTSAASNDHNNVIAPAGEITEDVTTSNTVISINEAISSEHPNKKKPNRKGCGRRGANEYTGAKIVNVTHPTLTKGALCPALLCDGKVYLRKRLGVVIRIQGGSLLNAYKYQLETYQCNLCDATYTASLPEDVSKTEKYDNKAKAIIAVNRIQMGIPMYRQAQWQEQIGIPLPEGTQWMLIKHVYEAAAPLFTALIIAAAQFDLFYTDDTWVRILAIIQQNKKAEQKQKKQSTYTTGVIAVKNNRNIILYFSGTQYAGQNLDDILKHRDKTLPAPLRMNDALSCNHTEHETVESNCTAHGRRKFVEIENYFPQECGYIITGIRTVYKNESHCKAHTLTPEQRLIYHQTHSKPVMEKLKHYMIDKLKDKTVEPNSSLGKAFNYWLKRWDKMTRYLTVVGAPIDNNLMEQGLKKAILFRKNCLFHKTVNSAHISSCLMSLIATTLAARVNPIDYLTAVLAHKEQVAQQPHCWLPWNYHEQLAYQLAA